MNARYIVRTINSSPADGIFGDEGVMSRQNIEKYMSRFEPEESLSGDVKQQIGSSKTAVNRRVEEKTVSSSRTNVWELW
jgi:hypothetical protein